MELSRRKTLVLLAVFAQISGKSSASVLNFNKMRNRSVIFGSGKMYIHGGVV